MMARLDIFLKNTGLIRQRSEAKRACDDGRVKVDDQPAKAGRPVKAGETLSLELDDRFIEAEILEVPERPPARKERPRYVRIVRQEKRDPYADLGF